MARRTTTTRNARTALAVEVSDTHGHSATLNAELRYAVQDAHAVTLVLPDGKESVPWVFARDLLLEGIYEPVGDGDVHVWPCLSPAGTSVVMIELVAPDGGVMIEASTRTVQEFLFETLVMVPRGQESEQYDVETALAVLRAS